jgi:hypothetical protein
MHWADGRRRYHFSARLLLRPLLALYVIVVHSSWHLTACQHTPCPRASSGSVVLSVPKYAARCTFSPVAAGRIVFGQDTSNL